MIRPGEVRLAKVVERQVNVFLGLEGGGNRSVPCTFLFGPGLLVHHCEHVAIAATVGQYSRNCLGKGLRSRGKRLTHDWVQNIRRTNRTRFGDKHAKIV